MMSALRSRTAQPLRGERTQSAMGVWGLGLTMVVLLMFLAGMSAAALYLETGQPRQGVTGEPETGWPPEGIPLPDMWLAFLAVALCLVGALALTWAVRRLPSGAERAAGGLAALATATFVAGALVLAADLQAAPFGWDEHAFTSIYWILTCTAITAMAVAAFMAVSVVVQVLVGVVDTRRHLEVVMTTGFAWFAAGASAVLLALVHLLPRVAGS